MPANVSVQDPKTAQRVEDTGDPVSRVLSQYKRFLADARTSPGSESRARVEAHRPEWVDSLRQALSEAPRSAYGHEARVLLLGLLNTSGRRRESLDVVDELIALSADARSRLDWLGEGIEVADNALAVIRASGSASVDPNLLARMKGYVEEFLHLSERAHEDAALPKTLQYRWMKTGAVVGRRHRELGLDVGQCLAWMDRTLCLHAGGQLTSGVMKRDDLLKSAVLLSASIGDSSGAMTWLLELEASGERDVPVSVQLVGYMYESTVEQMEALLEIGAGWLDRTAALSIHDLRLAERIAGASVSGRRSELVERMLHSLLEDQDRVGTLAVEEQGAEVLARVYIVLIEHHLASANTEEALARLDEARLHGLDRGRCSGVFEQLARSGAR